MIIIINKNRTLMSELYDCVQMDNAGPIHSKGYLLTEIDKN